MGVLDSDSSVKRALVLDNFVHPTLGVLFVTGVRVLSASGQTAFGALDAGTDLVTGKPYLLFFYFRDLNNDPELSMLDGYESGYGCTLTSAMFHQTNELPYAFALQSCDTTTDIIRFASI